MAIAFNPPNQTGGNTLNPVVIWIQNILAALTASFNSITIPNVALTKSFTSTQQTITSAGSLTIAHGLGAMPALIQARIHCLTAEQGYSVGDEVLINPGADFDGTNSRGLSIVPDTTNLNIRYGSATNAVLALAKSSGSAALITNANWALIVRAWA